MKLDANLIGPKVTEIFENIDFFNEVSKFFCDFECAKSLKYGIGHLEKPELMNIIDIPEEDMIFGEISGLTHMECGFSFLNPCKDYFDEIFFGSRFDSRIFNFKSLLYTAERFQPDKSRLAVYKLNFEIDDFKVTMYELAYTFGQSGDPWYICMDINDLRPLCNKIIEFHTLEFTQFEDYLMMRILENYESYIKIDHKLCEHENLMTNIIDDMEKSLKEVPYKWWELD